MFCVVSVEPTVYQTRWAMLKDVCSLHFILLLAIYSFTSGVFVNCYVNLALPSVGSLSVNCSDRYSCIYNQCLRQNTDSLTCLTPLQERILFERVPRLWSPVQLSFGLGRELVPVLHRTNAVEGCPCAPARHSKRPVASFKPDQKLASDHHQILLGLFSRLFRLRPQRPQLSHGSDSTATRRAAQQRCESAKHLASLPLYTGRRFVPSDHQTVEFTLPAVSNQSN